MQMQEHKLLFNVEAVNSGEFYLDIPMAMSMVNRKGYNQMGLWHIAKMEFFLDFQTQPGEPGIPLRQGTEYHVDIRGAPRTWTCRNSLVKMFSLWKDQQKQAYDQISPSIKPKWQDFKVWLSQDHKAGTTLEPVSGGIHGSSDAYNPGEWVHSKIVTQVADAAGAVVEHEPQLHIIGPDNANVSKGIIHQYAESRAYVQSPDPLIPSGMDSSLYAASSEGLADQTIEIAHNMETDNNEPPYDFNEYPGGGTNAVDATLYEFVSNSSTRAPKLTAGPMSAPNGLFEIQLSSVYDSSVIVPASGSFWIQVTVLGQEAY